MPHFVRKMVGNDIDAEADKKRMMPAVGETSFLNSRSFVKVGYFYSIIKSSYFIYDKLPLLNNSYPSKKQTTQPVNEPNNNSVTLFKPS